MVEGLAATTTLSASPAIGELFLLTSPFIDPLVDEMDSSLVTNRHQSAKVTLSLAWCGLNT